MGIAAQAGYILDAVPRRLPGTESRACYIYGIGTAIDSCDADIGRTGRCKQFQQCQNAVRT